MIFDSGVYIIFIALVVAGIYTWLLYSSKYSWSKRFNYLLAVIRYALVFVIIFLLGGPILKQLQLNYEKPGIVFAVDNSASLAEVIDSVTLSNHYNAMQSTAANLQQAGFETFFRSFSDESLQFNYPNSDIQGLLKNISNEYEGKNIKATVLFSDGIYNSGISPLYSSFLFPVYTLAAGDTTIRTDLAIKHVTYNKISYQGNRFPVRVEVMVSGYRNKAVKVDVFQAGRLIASQQQNSADKGLLEFNFLFDADKAGVQQYGIRVNEAPEEFNTKNNSQTIFVDVVEGRKKILLIAPAPHPDIKALRSIVEANSNYEFLVHIPGVMPLPPNELNPPAIDLVIFHQSPDRNNRTTTIYNEFVRAGTPRLLLAGKQLNSRLITTEHWPAGFESITTQWDEVTPVLNSGFDQFLLSQEMDRGIRVYPPVTVPFGRVQVGTGSVALLNQRIGNLETDRPLLLINTESARTAIMLGEGVWRWPLQEHARTSESKYFSELFSKLIQFLATQDEKRKFRFYPISNEFADTEPVVFEAEAYNELFERVYGNSIQLDIVNEAGQKTDYNFTPQPGFTQYRLSGLPEGAYTYTAKTSLGGRQESVQGRFIVAEQNLEQQNLVADFDLLRKLAANTGAKFYEIGNIHALEEELKQGLDARPLLRTQESFMPLINLKWLFFMLLLLVSLEWFMRKYLGSY
ncbi:MAG TPA: hypothetical protein PKC24_01655 [Cyclobacteriaceae bacterium]|nr:hypothetical protein [Cyclobacteriaceae bacterium]